MLFFFFFFSKRVQILKTEYKYGQYCTPLSESDCRYFFVLAIKVDKQVLRVDKRVLRVIKRVLRVEN